MKIKYFKVKTGFGADDFISVSEDELQMAIRAQITGKVAIFSEGSISGNSILSITPDYNRFMGWNRDHQLSSEDYSEIGKGQMNEYREILAKIKQKVQLERSGLPELSQPKENG